MTPAIILLQKKKISHQIHEYAHDVASESYGLEAAEKLGVDPSRIFKTLVVSTDAQVLIVGITPVNKQLNMKLVAKVIGVKKVAMADKSLVERTTGYVLGGVSPLGQKKRLKTLVDSSAKNYETIYVSAGRRGLEIELSTKDLVSLSGATIADIAQ